MGEKINPYHLSSHCLNGFRVMLSPGDDNGINGVTYEEDLFISHIPEQPLPFEESAIIPVDSTKCIKILSTFPMEYIDKIDLSDFKSDKVIVTLKIDINSFFDFQVIPWKKCG
uniref:Uncharacterized protein n=1 Tax=Panagrolaimus superbus TaxID=310955 RepID=A0A914YAA6_9BILA